MAKHKKQPTLVQCSRCEASSGYIVDNSTYVCGRCGFTRNMVEETHTEEKEKMWPYTEDGWEFISNAGHVPAQEEKEEESKKEDDVKDSIWDDYPYIPISQWLYKRH